MVTIAPERGVGEVLAPALPRPEEPGGLKGWARVAHLIREGSRKRPQSHRGYFEGGRSCALGALWEGMTGLSDFPPYQSALDMLDEATREHAGVSIRQKASLSIETCYGVRLTDTVWAMIIRLNDGMRWSREQIADWVETLATSK